MLPVFDPFASHAVLPLHLAYIPLISVAVLFFVLWVVCFSKKSSIIYNFKPENIFNINAEPLDKVSADKIISEYDSLFSRLFISIFSSLAFVYVLIIFQYGILFSAVSSDYHQNENLFTAFSAFALITPVASSAFLVILFISLKKKASYCMDKLCYVEYNKINDDFLKYFHEDKIVSEYVSKVISSGRNLTAHEVEHMNDRLLEIKSKSIAKLILSTKPTNC